MQNLVVIGGSSGIGLQIVERLASQGHMVFASYNSHPVQEKANVRYFQLNVHEKIDFPEWLPELIDGLVYCPGTIDLKPFKRLKADALIDDYRTNVIGAVEVIQKLMPRMKKSSIVLFSTVAVQLGMKYHAQVASSKGAIEGLTRSLAAELAPAIRVNAIAPSLTDTPLSTTLLRTEEHKEKSAQRHPLQRIGSTDDVASAATFLLSSESSWITGQILHIDGGLSSINL